MKAYLQNTQLENKKYRVQVTGSKSESNRLLILQATYQNFKIENLSESDDTVYLRRALKSEQHEIDIHHAGTAMRFLTAYFACQPGRNVLLTGSQRMQERPIGILVEALRTLGADIQYAKNEGFPPLRINGKSLDRNQVSIKAHTSSQYISALMLIGSSLPDGLTIELLGTPTSVPYIQMTLSLLKRVGIHGEFDGQQIYIPPCKNVPEQVVTVESDWSSASYFYSIAALSNGLQIELQSYRQDSLQGDAALAKLFEVFGVSTSFDSDTQGIRITKHPNHDLPNAIAMDLVDTPDIAQTIAVVCFGLGVECDLTGLHTLKIKETDRLLALKQELEKLGAHVVVTDESLHLKSSNSLVQGVTIETYNDHRMAMAFAPLAQKCALTIADCEVVSKSFPSFWTDLQEMGFSMKLQ